MVRFGPNTTYGGIALAFAAATLLQAAAASADAGADSGSVPVTPAIIAVGSASSASISVLKTVGMATVTVSKAADAAGQPVDYSRVILSAQGGSSGLAAVGQFPSRMPVSAAALTSGFGWRRHPVLGSYRAHRGVDLAAPMGTPIIATSDGTVRAAGWSGGYGLLVALDHGGGMQTRYGHMSRVNVVPGQRVRSGEVIGFVGSTGMSTGSHLHYEVRVNGEAVNPMPRRR